MALLPLLPLIAFLYGLFLLVFRSGRRKFGAKIIGGSVVVFFALGIYLGTDQTKIAEDAGFESVDEYRHAKEYDIETGEEWAVRKAGIVKEETAKAEAARIAKAKEEAERDQKRLAKEEAERKAEKAQLAALEQEKAEEHRKGFHCLSAWDGSHRELVNQLKDNLRDPDSFEHIETRVAPVNDEGNHTALIKYRARNGFGGMNVEQATGFYSNETCTAILVSTN